MTAEGFRPYPTIEELLRQAKIPEPQLPEGVPPYPLLLTASWCPFTRTARELWSEAAKATGQTLTIVDVGSGAGLAELLHANGCGVPCVATAPGKLVYGMVSAEEATAFLNASLSPTRERP